MTLAPEWSASAEALFDHALRGAECQLMVAGRAPMPLPIADWTRPPDRDDHALLDLCVAPVLDIGCGPGRLTAALSARGVPALGVDVSAEAVRQATARGARALRRDVFDPLPGEGSWATALLADGNIGIGGDPLALLVRLRRLLAPGGLVVTEVAGPGLTTRSVTAHLRCLGARSAEFPWAVVGADGLPELTAAAGLVVRRLVRSGERWFAVLGERL